MKHILCLFDYGPNTMTGYATVSRNIVAELKNHFGPQLQLTICAINYYGEPYTEYDGTVQVFSAKNEQLKMPILPGSELDHKKMGVDFGLLFFMDRLKNLKVDGIYYIGDLGVIAPIVPILKLIRQAKIDIKEKPFTSVIYFPVDGKMHRRTVNKEYDASKIKNIHQKHQKHFTGPTVYQVDALEFFDYIVTYTEYGKKEVLSHRPDFKNRLMVIYHGTNTADFYRMEDADIEKFRKKYFGWNAGKYIIGCINRNQPRKDIPAMIFAFMHLKKIWPAALPQPFLYFHMSPTDPKGWNLRDLLSLTDLEEGKDYMFPVGGDANYQVDVDTLRSIYNAIDVSVSTARGGGWELPITEAMACKTPCIIPDHTSLAEIGMEGHNAIMLTELLPVADISDNTIRYMCHFEEVAEQIVYVASNRDLVEHREIPWAYKWVTGLTWQNVCIEWINIFETAFFD